MNSLNDTYNLYYTMLKLFQSHVFRVPVFSLDGLEKVIRTIDLLKLSDRLQGEATFLASPSLVNEIEQQSKKSTQNNTLNLQISVLKYYIRMSSRCTPFGLFAGCGIGEVGQNSRIELDSLDKHKSYTRLDMNYLCALIHNIAQTDIINEQVNFYPNSSLYASGKDLRYTEYQFFKTRRKYSLSEAEQSEYLTAVLQKAKGGATIEGLASLLVDEDISIEDAREFINELITNQILVSELEPSVTGDDLLYQFIGKLERLKGTEKIVATLKRIKTLLQTIDNSPIGRPIEMYEHVKKKLENFKTQYDEKYLFQSDLFIESKQAFLGKAIPDTTYKAIEVFNRLTPKFENPVLKKFREEFYSKYEDEEIPLVQALDVETGIGFGNIDGQRGDIAPLLDGILFAGQQATFQDIKISPVMWMLNQKYDEFIKENLSDEINITDDDLKDFPEHWGDLPDTISAIIEVIRTEKSPDGPLIALGGAGGTSAANLLGRFCYLNKKIHHHVKQVTSKEQELNPDKIMAEIVHLPESRIGNILMRPVLREYEIPYLANSSVTNDKVIPITDLMISVHQGQTIKLKSKRWGKEVVPRLSSAHNFSSNSLPIYHFLCAMQSQGIRGGVSFNWGQLLEGKPFLPRVRYQNIIFSPAIWNISPKDTNKIPKITDSQFYEKALEFKHQKRLPDKVLLVQGDNKLLIDFQHKLSVQMLFSEVKKHPFRLEEFLFKDNQYPLVKRGNEVFTNQVILSFYRDKN